MGLKLNISNIQSNSTDTKKESAKLNISKLTTENAATTAAEVSESAKLNLNTLSSTNTTNTTTQDPTKINSMALKSAAQMPESGYSLTFTDGAEYNLDDIIFAKRRDNDECPLIVKVDDNDTNDQEIIKAITKLILDDYGVSYDSSKDDDESDPDCYKNRVNQIPNFYIAFNNYFNKYYQIYYDNTKRLQTGSLSLSSIIENIQTVHDAYAATTELGISSYNNASVWNKPTVNIEYGTQPEEYDDNYDVIDTTLLAAKFKLGTQDGYLNLYYDGQLIKDSGVLIQKLIYNITAEDYIDLAECPEVTVADEIELELPAEKIEPLELDTLDYEYE